MIGFISKIFGGSKSEKDVKAIMPLVTKINQNFEAYQLLTNDQLRYKTVFFRERIKEHLKDIDAQIAETNKRADDLPFDDLIGKDTVYQEVDKLKKDRDDKIEEILKEILPEAFAVVKETAKRFKENTELVADATELDRELSVTRNHITIDGEKVIYKNSWIAGGGQITWNMVHYDVQLIGGAVLHSGKIAEM